MIDIHCHLLPGIDDGPKDWTASLDLCRAMRDNGITKAVATPHLIDGVYANTRSKVEPLTAELVKRCRDADISLEILSGAEIDLSSTLVTSHSTETPLLGGGNAVLLEMPMAVLPHAMSEILFSIRSTGWVPVLAHPERNEILQENLDLAGQWIESGALLQLDGDSLLDVWGKRARRCGEALLVRGWIHAMASDAHSIDRRPPRLAEAVAAATNVVGSGAISTVTTGPSMILDGHPLPTPLFKPKLSKAGSRSHRDGRSSGRASRSGSSKSFMRRWFSASS